MFVTTFVLELCNGCFTRTVQVMCLHWSKFRPGRLCSGSRNVEIPILQTKQNRVLMLLEFALADIGAASELLIWTNASVEILRVTRYSVRGNCACSTKAIYKHDSYEMTGTDARNYAL